MFGECQKGSAEHCPSASPCCAWCCQRDQRRALPRGVYNPAVTTPLSRSPPRQESRSSSAGGHLTSSQPAVGLFRLPVRDPTHKALPGHTGMISKNTCLDMVTTAGEQPPGRCGWCFLFGSTLAVSCCIKDMAHTPFLPVAQRSW